MTDDELEHFGLGPTDVIYDERLTANEAASMGISSAEYRQRRQQSFDAGAGKNSECENVDVVPSDKDRAMAIQYGVSIQT
jgi:hypothetical protein